ncbi:selenide, water dikinase SelD [Candidatus Bathyarchaeota archaeon]|nr:MAG: selenide, water dikinase SelD [Candidatus Bathyarchaeota archaeon]
MIITTTDFFTPIIDDPYVQGQIAACNATNDVYAKGGLTILSVLALMGMPESMPLGVQKEVLKGFCDFCRSLDAPVLGGHTIICPWPIMGGAVTAIAEMDEIVLISKAQLGDKVILTKPLGIQPVMRLLRLSDSEQKEIASIVSEDELSNAIDLAIRVMTTSNRDAAFAMLETGVNAATDVTGFGLLGHASNMAEQSSVSIRINTLPVIRGAPQVANALGYPLLQGKASETAGGLLISLPKERVDQLLGALKERGVIGYVIGDVQKGQRKAFLDEDSEVLEVPS